jgi:hypothetical protein
MNDLFEIECCECGLLFAIRKNVQAIWARDNKTFYCPNGHSQSWVAPISSVKDQAELKCLRSEVQELKGKLYAALNNSKVLISQLEVPHPNGINKE